MGYLVCSRYDTVWHVMNVAVDDRLLREGIATAAHDHLFELGRPAASEQYTLEVRTSNEAAIRALRAVRLPRRGAPARLLPRQPRGRPDHVAHRARARGAPRRVILALETSCDDTCAAVVTGDGRGALERDRLAGAAARALRRRGARGGLAPPSGAGGRGDRRRARAGGASTLDDVERVAVTRGPGLIGALLVGVSSAKALAAARGLPLVPVDHLHGHVVASTLGPDPIEPPYLCLVASGGHTFLARVDDPARYRVLGQTLDDAAGEAFDKGARLLGPRLSGRPGARPAGARAATRTRSTFPRAAPGDGSTSASAA